MKAEVKTKPKTRTGKQILKELEQFKRGFMRGYLAAKKANQSK